MAWALAGDCVYGVLKVTVGLRLSQEEEYDGADLSVHRISATPDREVTGDSEGTRTAELCVQTATGC